AVCLVISGGLGNMIDRVFRGGNVVDFLHFEFYPTFPVFNVADIFVCIGAGLLAIFFVFIEEKYRKERENHDNQG
ncbi:MAG: signal peptidase II, partial [Clostridia bacterium]|nr:signal peptidase II [Clostridia bacterium]